MTEPSLISTWAPVVSWGLVLLGWWRVTRENDRRQRRKETRERIDIVLDMLDELEDAAVEYFTSAPGSVADKTSRSIKSTIGKLGHHVAILARISDRYNCAIELTRLRKAITGGDFDSQSRIATTVSDERFLEIAQHSTAVARKLDSAFALSQD